MGANHSDSEEHLESKLGTKEYWEDRYKMELDNFDEMGDEGEIWFGRAAENRGIRYLQDAGIKKDARIMDLGCGNGSMLRHLRKLKFTDLTGVDYCEDAVRLARSVAKQEAEEAASTDLPSINFQVADVLAENTITDRFDVVMDKGTWDAMSLSSEKATRLRQYRNCILNITTVQGRFVIFSCNFTKDELKEQFDGDGLVFETEIGGAKAMSYGGKIGVTSTGAVFRRVPGGEL